MESKQKNILIGIAVAVLIVVAAIGVAVWVLSSNNEVKGTDEPYISNTPTSSTDSQVGSVAVGPEKIALVAGIDGRTAGDMTVTALFRDLTVTDFKFDGDNRLSLNSNCLRKGSVLKAGEPCAVKVSFDGKKNDPTAIQNPTFHIVGNSTTPGGSAVVVEATAPVVGTVPGSTPEGQPIPGASGVPGEGGPLAGGAAPSTIDPYGPVAAQPASAPPVDYNQQPAPAPALTPREQFMIARRQAVLGNVVVRNAQTNQVISTGDWDEIKVPKTVSSAPQDMSRVVTMDRVITAVLSRPFDSRASQQVVAQVDRNVYGAAGRNILIPRGSTIIGNMAGGADRVAVVWTQIIRPDGARIVFSGSGGDAMGQGGVPGRVNNRYGARISAAMLGTILKVGTALASNAQEQPGNGNNIGGGSTSARNNGAIVTDITTQGINQMLAPIIAQQQQLKPIITVPQGTRLTIVPNMDLVMRPVERETIVKPTYPRQMNGGAQISAPPAFDDENGQGGGSYQQSNRQLQGYNAPQQSGPTQASVSRSLQTAPVTASATPPWSTN